MMQGPSPGRAEENMRVKESGGAYKRSDPFYHSTEWKRVRAAALMRDGGMCQICMQRLRDGYGIKPRRATMVHHIIPRSERPDLELQLDNLVSLCARCHEQEHTEKRDKMARGRAGELPGPRHGMRVIKV